ncbi:MAG: hypothetical protein QM774_05965 [Gordonia sp. (in: high G+C Gram-positive bacteria)]|uniref:hypothetical protein n=1 Tax=Gordonia sp. (in: high G+C Gram-positive bacteria) TaxID=84139 RepID=UPI0039E5A36F
MSEKGRILVTWTPNVAEPTDRRVPMRRWFSRKRAAEAVSLDALEDADVLAECRDEALSSSSVLADAGFSERSDVVLRHVVFLRPEETDVLVGRYAADGYSPVSAIATDPAPPDGRVAVAVARVQTVDPVSLSRERALMTSAASRVGGAYGGWTILGVPGR